MNTDTQKPSEHAMRAAKELGGGDIEAYLIDQHAIAPAVFELHEKLTKRYQESLSKCHARLAERDKRIAELEDALQTIAGTTMSKVASMEHGFYRCVGIAKAVLKPKKGQP